MYVNATLSLLQTVFSILALFYSYKLVISEIGIGQLGLWALMVSIVALSRIAELGLSGSLLKYVSSYLAVGKNTEANQAIDSATLSISIVVGVVMCLAYLPVEQLILFILNDTEIYQSSGNILLLCFATTWIAAIAGVNKIALEGGQRYDLSTLSSIISISAFMVAIVFLIPEYKIKGLAYAIAIQHSVMFIGCRIFLLRSALVTSLMPIALSKSVLKDILIYGLNFQLISILKLLLEPITKAYLGKFGNVDLVGYFELANRFATQMRRILVAMNQVVIPRVSEIDAKGLLDIKPMYRRNCELIVFISIYFFSALLCTVPLLETLWFEKQVPEFEIMSVVAIIAFFINTLSIPAYMTNLGLGDMKQNVRSHMLMAISNIALGLLLGFYFGGLGVVMAWGIALVLGTYPILIPFHVKHKILLLSVVQKADAAGLLVCFIGVGMVWYFHDHMELFGSFLKSFFYTVLMTLVIILLPMLLHPTRLTVQSRIKHVMTTMLKKYRPA